MAAAVEITPAIIPTARRVPDRFRTLSGTIAAVAPLILVVIVAILFQQAAPAVRHFGLGFLAGTDWNPVTDTFGDRKSTRLNSTPPLISSSPFSFKKKNNTIQLH